MPAYWRSGWAAIATLAGKVHGVVVQIIACHGPSPQAAGTPLTGVSVSVVGTALTGRTDAAGRYVVGSVPPGTQRLRVRRLGYAPADKSVAVREGEQAVADFRLRTSAVELQEVVAVGYGEQTKATLTGSVSAVQGRELKTVPTVNLSNTGSGSIAG